MMVPSGWKETRLGKISEKVTSGSRDWAQYYSDSGSKFIRMTNLSRGGIYLNLDDLKFVDVKNDSSDGKRTSLKPGDVLISITAELGKIGWVDDSLGEAFINQHTALVRIDSKKAFSKYLAYLLSSHSMNHKINRLNDAGAKAGLNLSTIRSIPLLVPPLPEQKKIAEILSTWDKAITTTDQLLANSQQQKKSLMQHLLTGKKRLLDDNGQMFTGEWEISKFYEILDIKKGKQLNRDTLSETGVYAVINGGVTPSGYTEVSNWKANTVTISEGGNSCGYVGLQNSPFWLGGHCYAVDSKNFSVNFTYHLLKFHEHKIMRLRVGSGLPNIQKKDMYSLKLLYPNSSEEQQKIATVLTAADQEIDTLKQKLDHLKQEKKALMQQLLTGKRRVNVG